jgi:hypothetical protein
LALPFNKQRSCLPFEQVLLEILDVIGIDKSHHHFDKCFDEMFHKLILSREGMQKCFHYLIVELLYTEASKF